jgi:hypothetical protein
MRSPGVIEASGRSPIPGGEMSPVARPRRAGAIPSSRPSRSKARTRAWILSTIDGRPDPARWTYDVERNREGWFNNELQYYAADRPENARVEGGAADHRGPP